MLNFRQKRDSKNIHEHEKARRLDVKRTLIGVGTVPSLAALGTAAMLLGSPSEKKELDPSRLTNATHAVEAGAGWIATSNLSDSAPATGEKPTVPPETIGARAIASAKQLKVAASVQEAGISKESASTIIAAGIPDDESVAVPAADIISGGSLPMDIENTGGVVAPVEIPVKLIAGPKL